MSESSGQERKKMVGAFSWKLMDAICGQGISFVVQVILARILMPEDFGQVTIMMVFINFGMIFIQSGYATSIIQRKDLKPLDITSVFWVSICSAAIIYLIIFFAAPFIADYYQAPNMTAMMRVVSINLFFGGLNAIQRAILSRSLKFKQIFLRSLMSTTISGTVSIAMAMFGCGVWALVVQTIMIQLINCVVMWICVDWKPSFAFSLESAKRTFRFSGKILLSSLLVNIYNDVRSLIIGKVYSKEQLAYYDRGQTYPNYIVQCINTSISAVMLPVFSKKQDDKESLKAMMRRSISVSSFLLFPLLFGLAAVSHNLVLVLLTEKWMEAVPYIMIFCIFRMPYPMHTINIQAYYAMGRSDITLKLEIIRAILNFSLLFVFLHQGTMAIALSAAILSVLSAFINAFPNTRLLSYHFSEQLKDICRPFFCAAIMGGAVYAVNYLPVSAFIGLLIQIAVGVAVYAGMEFLIRDPNVDYVRTVLRDFRKKGKKA